MLPPPAEVPNRNTRLGVAAERGDVSVEPVQHGDLVEARVVAGDLLGALGRERRMRQEAEDAEPDVEAHEDHVATSGEHLAVVGDAAEPRRALSGERVVASPGQPDHHGARALCWVSRAPRC